MTIELTSLIVSIVFLTPLWIVLYCIYLELTSPKTKPKPKTKPISVATYQKNNGTTEVCEIISELEREDDYDDEYIEFVEETN